MKSPFRLSSAVLAATTPLFAQGDPDPPQPTRVTATAAGGEVAVRHVPVTLPGRSLEQIQRRGTVWSMGAREAAVLETSVALASGPVVIPPGRYRMSTWFKGPGDWRLLVFSRGANYKRGTPYLAVPLQHDEQDEASAAVRFALRAQRGRLGLELRGGTSRLRAQLRTLAVHRHDGTIAGQPATYEFYAWPAVGEVHNRLRSFEPLQFGRIRSKAPFGIVYELTCRNDGKGVFIDARSTTLRDNRERLAETARRRRDAPEDAALARRQAALQQAIDRQRTLQPNVMVPGSVVVEESRTPSLEVRFSETGTRAFDLSFGLRRVNFTIGDDQFKRLRWK